MKQVTLARIQDMEKGKEKIMRRQKSATLAADMPRLATIKFTSITSLTTTQTRKNSRPKHLTMQYRWAYLPRVVGRMRAGSVEANFQSCFFCREHANSFCRLLRCLPENRAVGAFVLFPPTALATLVMRSDWKRQEATYGDFYDSDRFTAQVPELAALTPSSLLFDV